VSNEWYDGFDEDVEFDGRATTALAIKRIAIMTQQWFKEFAEKRGFPDDYVVVDIETSGFRPELNLICSIGHGWVKNRKISKLYDTYLNWSLEPTVEQTKLQQDLEKTQLSMESKGACFHHTYKKLVCEGQSPGKVLEYYHDLFQKAIDSGIMLVMHNGWAFDVRFLEGHFRRWLGKDFTFPEDSIYDTGICEKASQLDPSYDPMPRIGETMHDFSKRISGIRARGVRWALDSHCEETYGLFKLAGVSPGDAHRSATDCLVMYHLFEQHRALAEAADG